MRDLLAIGQRVVRDSKEWRTTLATVRSSCQNCGMPVSRTIGPTLNLDELLARTGRLERAMGALETLISATPSGQELPLPLRLALRDFGVELARLDRQRGAEPRVRSRQPRLRPSVRDHPNA